MRIGINAQLLGGRESGVELCIRHLIAALSEVDAANDYVVYTHDGAMPIEHREGWRVEWRVRQPRSRSRAARIAWEQTRLGALLRRDGVDVLHAPGYVMPARCPAPTVLTVHDVIALKRPDLASRANVAHYRLLLPRSLRSAAVVVASSDATKRDILDIVPAANVRVVHPGCDPIFFERPSERALDEARGSFKLPERYVLFVGNLEPKKNLPTLFEAVARLKAQGRWDRALVVVGATGWKRAQALAGLERLEAGRDVRFCGYAPRAHMPALYALADAFVFPSLYEGFGLPVVEAMACGTPVVCSTTPALAETAGAAALQVAADNADELAEAVWRVLHDDGLRRSLASKGRARAMDFSWARTARAMVGAYESASVR